MGKALVLLVAFKNSVTHGNNIRVCTYTDYAVNLGNLREHFLVIPLGKAACNKDFFQNSVSF